MKAIKVARKNQDGLDYYFFVEFGKVLEKIQKQLAVIKTDKEIKELRENVKRMVKGLRLSNHELLDLYVQARGNDHDRSMQPWYIVHEIARDMVIGRMTRP
jgi:hypothetical protein